MLAPFGNPINFVPASRGGVYLESKETNEIAVQAIQNNREYEVVGDREKTVFDLAG